MSKIAREITKKASTVALATALFLQPVCAGAVEITNIGENNTSVVEKTADITEMVETEAVEENTEAAAKVKEEVKDEDVVKFTDANFEKYIRYLSNVPDTRKVTKKDVEKISIINIEKDQNIKNVDGIESFTGLRYFLLKDDIDIDISAVANCTSLVLIDLKNKSYDVDLDMFKKLTNLRTLQVAKCSNTNLDALESCRNMEELLLADAPYISDISAVRNMRNLEHIAVRGNENQKGVLKDISDLEGLNKLYWVDLVYTSISNKDISIFAQLPKLEKILLAGCEITDVSELFSLIDDQRFAVIWLNQNKISDPTLILQRKYFSISASNQEVTLPEIVTRGGDVTVKLANSEYITEVKIDEKEGKYNPETNEITFYNVTEDKEVKYKVRMQNNINSEIFPPLSTKDESAGYDYSAMVTQPLRIGEPVEEVTDKIENSGQEVVDNASLTNTSVVKEIAKTGDSGALGTLSLAFISVIGAVKTRKKK